VLASGSPRRRELLEAIGLAFTVRPPRVEEKRRPGESPQAYVTRLSAEKADAARSDGELVLAADTVVVLDDDVLEKPLGRSDAVAMLERLAGRQHRVLTGVTLQAPDGRGVTRVAESLVHLRRLDRHEIEWYVDTGEPDDKAGSYALQGIGGLFVDSIRGSASNVIGLPLSTVYELFSDLGLDLLRFVDAARQSTDAGGSTGC